MNLSYSGLTATEAWLTLMEFVISGEQEMPGARSGVPGTLVAFCDQIRVDALYPVVHTDRRALSHRFMCAEAAWILSGSNRLADLSPYAPSYKRFSDDGLTLAGAYGPSVVQQIPYVVHEIRENIWTRQAVMSIWKPSPRQSKDIPCTIAITFFVTQNKRINADVYMRSSDTWLGFPYDIFSFSMILWEVARQTQLEVGYINHYAVNRHVYETDIEKWQNGDTKPHEGLLSLTNWVEAARKAQPHTLQKPILSHLRRTLNSLNIEHTINEN